MVAPDSVAERERLLRSSLSCCGSPPFWRCPPWRWGCGCGWGTALARPGQWVDAPNSPSFCWWWLPPRLWRAAAEAGQRPKPAQPCVSFAGSMKHRGAAADCGGAGGRQTLLTGTEACAVAQDLRLAFGGYLCRFDRFASLFPFQAGARAGALDVPGGAAATALWTGFDVTSNLIGYAPWASCWPWPCCARGWTRGGVVGRAGGFAAVAGHGVLQITCRGVSLQSRSGAECCGHMAGRLCWRRCWSAGAIDRWSLFGAAGLCRMRAGRWC